MKLDEEETALKNLIPFYGSKSVEQKIKELENKYLSLLFVIGYLLGKSLEGIINPFKRNIPIHIFGIDVSHFFWYSLSAIILVTLYIYADERRRVIKKAKEKAQEKKTQMEQEQTQISSFNETD